MVLLSFLGSLVVGPSVSFVVFLLLLAFLAIFISPFVAPSRLVWHLLLFLLRLPRSLFDFGATCMSTGSDPILDLLSAVQQLQASVEALSARLGVVESRLGVNPEDEWEVVEESFEPPSRVTVPSVGVSTAVPDIPAALLSFAERLSSVAPGHIVRAKRAFESGFRARIALETGTWFLGAKTSIPQKDTVWILVQARGISKPHRVALKSDLHRLWSLPGSGGDVICQGFPSLTEAQIFCAGCDIAVPPLYKWRKN